jgi:signal transduction histidine kinase
MDALRRLARWIGTGADIALAAVMAAVIAASAVPASRSDSTWPLGLGILIYVTALLRGRNRAWAAVIGLALFAAAGVAATLGAEHGGPGPLLGGGLVGLLVLGGAAMRTLAPRAAAGIGVAGTAVIAVSETAGPAGFFDNRALWALAGTTLWSAALAAGLYLRYLDFLQAQALDGARRQERLELARELHDAVAHHVTGIVVQAQAAQFAGGTDPAPLIAALSGIETAGADTMAAIRQLVGLLRDPEDTSGVTPEPEPISQLVERFTRHGPAVELQLPASLADAAWPPQVTSTVYRIIQEALTNVARHACGARSVTVTVACHPQHVTVEVTDDAPGVPAPHGRLGGYGLTGMRERVEALGGMLHAGPRASTGWAVRASLPVPAPGRP